MSEELSVRVRLMMERLTDWARGSATGSLSNDLDEAATFIHELWQLAEMGNDFSNYVRSAAQDVLQTDYAFNIDNVDALKDMAKWAIKHGYPHADNM